MSQVAPAVKRRKSTSSGAPAKNTQTRPLSPRQFAMQVMLRVIAERGPSTIKEIEAAAGLTYCGTDGFGSLAQVLERKNLIWRSAFKWEKHNKRRSVVWALVEKST